jgi:hypothetical protein
MRSCRRLQVGRGQEKFGPDPGLLRGPAAARGPADDALWPPVRRRAYTSLHTWSCTFPPSSAALCIVAFSPSLRPAVQLQSWRLARCPVRSSACSPPPPVRLDAAATVRRDDKRLSGGRRGGDARATSNASECGVHSANAHHLASPAHPISPAQRPYKSNAVAVPRLQGRRLARQTELALVQHAPDLSYRHRGGPRRPGQP